MWKVVLHKKCKSQQVVANVYDDYIETHGKAFGFEIPLEFLDVNNSRTLVGDIELSRQYTLLASQALRSSLKTNDV
jgi:hypothetical protein